MKTKTTTKAIYKKKKVHRPGNTLAKDITQLQSKKLDLEFSVDPLFRKTCADFDEGGAYGLLMNHLSLGVGKEGCLAVVFDAGDSVVQEEQEEDTEQLQEDVDLSFLRSECFWISICYSPYSIQRSSCRISPLLNPKPSLIPLTIFHGDNS